MSEREAPWIKNAQVDSEHRRDPETSAYPKYKTHSPFTKEDIEEIEKTITAVGHEAPMWIVKPRRPKTWWDRFKFKHFKKGGFIRKRWPVKYIKGTYTPLNKAAEEAAQPPFPKLRRS